MRVDGNPKIVKGEKDGTDNTRSQNVYLSNKKRKFEGWPMLWLLIAIFLISAVLWYTGKAIEIIEWIKK